MTRPLLPHQIKPSGNDGWVLATDPTTGRTVWVSPESVLEAIAGVGTDGQVLTVQPDLSLAWETPATSGPRTINAQTGTTYTLALTDGGPDKFLTLTNGSAVTLTVPDNATVAFPIGITVAMAQLGAGQVTLTPAAGVTINAVPGLKIAAAYGVAELLKTGTNTWLAFGRLSA